MTAVPVSNRRMVGAFLLGGSPLLLWTVLNLLRPDLVGAMLEHPFGYEITTVEGLLIIAGTAAQVTAPKLRSGGARLGLSLAGALLFTLPALLLVLFGPIVFAFKYGNAQ